MKVLLLSLCLSLTGVAQTLQESRWASASLRPEKIRETDAIIDRILKNKARYVAVDRSTGVPWYTIAGLHNMESGGSFSKHLYEGSPLTGRTRYVPKGRPTWGKPPYKWEEAAADALFYDKLDKVDWKKLNDTLYAIESYNGLGYLLYHPSVPSHYLWSGTTIYIRGRYVADGKWSSTSVSKQIGVAAIFKRMETRGLLNFRLLR